MPTQADPYYFDAAEAERHCQFFERVLKLTEGEWAGRPFRLQDWQAHHVRQIYGWRHKKTKLRKHRIVYIEIPRKNAKTTLGAGFALDALVMDNEQRAQVLSVAADEEQARLCFATASAMVEISPSLSKIIKPYRTSLYHAASRSHYKVLTAKPSTKHGFSPHCVVFDELHAQPHRELWDVMNTGHGARRQPLIIALTTAGHDRNSICWEQHDRAIKVRDGVLNEPYLYPVIYAAEREDDWRDPKVWAKANPGLGISPKMEFLEERCNTAIATPSFENTFKRLHLNIWTEQADRWLPMDSWDKCRQEPLEEAELREGPCYAGMDLSSTRDLTAISLYWPHCEALLTHAFLPGDDLRERELRDRVPYREWAEAGLLTLTPGNVIDYRAVRAQAVELHEAWSPEEWGYDPYNATQLAVQLSEEEGLPMVMFRQGFLSMNEPSKRLETLFVSGKLWLAGNPMLRWQLGNVAVKSDPAGCIKPDKARSPEKIDGVVASIMAIGCSLHPVSKEGPSIYETRGLITL